MKYELEITTKYLGTSKELHEELVSKKFHVVDNFRLYDIYMLPCDIDLNNYDNLSLLSKFILIRQIDDRIKNLCYKYKEYDSKGNITKQSKSECNIENIDNAKKFMESINYKELFTIDANVTIYTNKVTEICVQEVKNLGIYIEYEQYNSRLDTINGNTLEEMIDNLNSYNLNIDKSNYFAKKAEDALNFLKTKN